MSQNLQMENLIFDTAFATDLCSTEQWFDLFHICKIKRKYYLIPFKALEQITNKFDVLLLISSLMYTHIMLLHNEGT